jgi:hypothetical protein
MSVDGVALRKQSRVRGSLAMKAIAAAMALSAVAMIRPATAEPGDIFTISAPAIGSEPPRATPIAAGDASVSTQTVAFNYAFGISVPPGRGAMLPASHHLTRVCAGIPIAVEMSVHQSPRSRRVLTHVVIRVRSFAG